MYWKPANYDTKNDPMIPLSARTFSPIVYTTQNVLVLICNAKLGDSSSSDNTSITITPGDENLVSPKSKALLTTISGDQKVDRVYLLDAVKDNTLTRVNFNIAVNPADAATDKQKDDEGKTGPAKHDAPVPPAGTDVAAWALIERHRISHYSIGGGLLVTRATPITYSGVTVPTTITTVTSIVSTTTVTTVGSGGSSGSSPTVTTSQTNTTTGTSSGTANYAQGVKGGSWQVDAVAGVTIYPFGRDTYTLTEGRGFAVPYGFRKPLDSLGVFVGTSVNTFGNFTVGPAFEMFPGIQAYAGATWWNKTSLQSGFTGCSAYGTSPPYSIPPNSTEDNSTTTNTPASGTTPASSTVVDIKTTVTTTATSGCANGDKATMISGTTTPTQSAYKPAFSLGILFNSNLMKAFSGVFK